MTQTTLEKNGPSETIIGTQRLQEHHAIVSCMVLLREMKSSHNTRRMIRLTAELTDDNLNAVSYFPVKVDPTQQYTLEFARLLVGNICSM